MTYINILKDVVDEEKIRQLINVGFMSAKLMFWELNLNLRTKYMQRVPDFYRRKFMERWAEVILISKHLIAVFCLDLGFLNFHPEIMIICRLRHQTMEFLIISGKDDRNY